MRPLERLTARLSRPWRSAVDWLVTIGGAVVIVLALKAWVVNPYRVPSESMEPTLHCARPAVGCRARFSDRILANRFIYHFVSPARGDIVVFHTPKAGGVDVVAHTCGESGTFVKRLIGLPGETVYEDRQAHIWIDGRRLVEPYVTADAYADDRTRTTHVGHRWRVPPGRYFFMGDNRGESCDSRDWGSVPRSDFVGRVFAVYFPPGRIGLR